MNKQRLSAIIALTRLDRPIGTFLLLWPTLTALLLASHGKPGWPLIIIMCLGALLVRSAGCCINDYFDRDIDPHVTRTQNRPLATKQLRGRDAIGVAALLFFGALLLALYLNPLSWLLCGVAFALTCFYPLSKRFWQLPQFILALTFNMGVLIAYSASSNALPLSAWLLYAANACFILAYDTQYAIVDRADDKKLPIGSTALLFGRYSQCFIVVCEAIALGLLLAVGIITELHWIYFTSIAIAAAYVVRQIIRMGTLDDSAYLDLFKQHHIILLWILGGTTLSTLF